MSGSLDSHPFGALKFYKNTPVHKIQEGIAAALGTRNPTDALHQVVALYTSRADYPEERKKELKTTFETAVKMLLQKEADIVQAYYAMEPYEDDADEFTRIIASEVNTTLKKLIEEHVKGKTGGKRIKKKSYKRKRSKSTKKRSLSKKRKRYSRSKRRSKH